MRQFWVYDWEVYKNLACVTFIHTSTSKGYLEAYIMTDIKYLNTINSIEKALEKDDINKIDELEVELEEHRSIKSQLLVLMNAKTFFIYRDTEDNSKNICQLGELLMFFNNHKVLMGYNSYKYDSFITDYILCQGSKFSSRTGFNTNNIHITQCLKEVSDEIINVSNNSMYGYVYPWLPRKYVRRFEDYDIQKILYLDKTYTGLKSVAINLKWHRIQELPIHFNSIIKYDEVFTIYDYNVNDVFITLYLTMNQEEEIVLREQISERYDIDVLNESRSSIGKRLMSKYYSEESGLQYKDFRDLRTIRGAMSLSSIITNRIFFINDKFKDFLSSLKKIVVTPSDKFNQVFEFNETFYTIAKGGIHSIDDSRIYNSIEDEYVYEDADVTSYYPAILEIFNISPAHLSSSIFLKLISFFKNDRVRAKKAGAKLEAESLKIVINRIYGALKDMNDYLFDPKATYQTTMNGQLSLLMLIEKLEVKSEGNIHIISANTDGIVSKYKPEYANLYKKLCKEWEKETLFELEFTKYELYARSNVNNYLAIKVGFRDKLNELISKQLEPSKYIEERKQLEAKYIKCKGTYSADTPFNKGFNHPIVSQALYNYLVYGDDYKEYIRTHWKSNEFAIYDYCMSQKVDKGFKVIYTRVVNGEIVSTPLQQYNRFYIAASGGGSITKNDVYSPKTIEVKNVPLSQRPSSKSKAKPKSVKRSESLVANENIELFNNFIIKEDYNINYNFYINKVEDFLFYKKKSSKGNHKLEGLEVRDITLFDNIL